MMESPAAVESHRSHFKRRHALLFIFYSSTGITNAVLLIMLGVRADWYPWNAVCFVSLAASLSLVVVAFVSLNRPLTAAHLGAFALILTWLSFGPLVFVIGVEFIGRLLDRNFTTAISWQESALSVIQYSLDGRRRSSMDFPIYILFPIILLASATVYTIWASLRNRAG